MVKDVSKDIAEFANTVPRATMKLPLFSKVFFPMFVELLKGQDVQVAAWLSETGTNGYQYVDIVDGQEVVFSVPPIFISNRTGLGDNLGKDVGDIMQVASVKEKTYPGAGDAHIRNNLINQLDYDDGHDAAQEKFINEWKAIFAHYGYEIPKVNAGVSASYQVDEGAFEDDIETF